MSLGMNVCERGSAGLLGVLALSAMAAAQPLNLPPAPAGVQVTTSYGIEFSTIGAPGNPPWRAAWSPFPAPGTSNFVGGSVDYTYRMARTELRRADWAPFVQAYVSTFGYPNGIDEFRNITGGVTFDDPTNGQFSLIPGAANVQVRSTWRMFAIYCNWLHNDRGEGSVTGAAAFQSGAYDTSTFTRIVRPVPGFGNYITYNDQPVRSPGARFWIPNRDEWLRAAYYNPNPAPGTSIQGWMRHPWNSDTYPDGGTVPIYGPPGTPNAAGPAGPGVPRVASYPDRQSPWGLLDISGGLSEWGESFLPSEDPLNSSGLRSRSVFGRPTPLAPEDNNFGGQDDLYWDGFGGNTSLPDSSGSEYGVRIASAIPSPTSAALSIGVMVLCARRRRISALLSSRSRRRLG